MASFGDTMFEMTLWLRTTWVVDFALWLESTAACRWLQEHFIAIPSVQSIHILAIAILFGSVLMVNLRVLGFTGGGHSVAQMTQRFMPWMWGGLAALICTGIILLISEPVRNMVNPFFWIKMTTLLIAALISIGFHKAVLARMDKWTMSSNGQGAIKASAGVLIILWLLVMAGGRFIAYAPV